MNPLTTPLTDQESRQAALNTRQSFIVQAPAGSGKTELLIQRILALLTTVTQPEEILALTFTKKAAHEMQERVIQALRNAQQIEPTSAHEKTTWRLANKVLLQDQEHQWHLTANPHRLRIMTIDAFAFSICQQAPLSSGLGFQQNIVENPALIYQDTVEQFLLQQHDSTQDDINVVSLHLNNRFDYLTSLLINLLAKRDQWLPHLMPNYQQPALLRKKLEQTCQRLIDNQLSQIDSLLNNEQKAVLLELLNYAAANKQESSYNEFPAPTWQQLCFWQRLAELLLTKSGTPRLKVDKRQGFPPPSSTEDPVEAEIHKQKKQLFLTTIDLLTQEAHGQHFLESLFSIFSLPAPFYQESQWETLQALVKLLPKLVALLRVNFNIAGGYDFIEINLAAHHLLGTFNQPSDLSFQLESQITHLLIDEFQDTSIQHEQLVSKLVNLWEPNTNKTVFLVGDPMQSIYRFRGAEVGLFLKIQQLGLNQWPLTSLVLQKNFRSQANIIHWINQTFEVIFPKNPSIISGAVAYSPAIPTIEASDQALHYYLSAHQGAQTVKIVQQLQKTGQTIAILVRSRKDFLDIAPFLKQANIAYQGLGLIPLLELPEIQDLLMLTRALHHPLDQPAWLGLLRSPWIGLTLTDIYTIFQEETTNAVWQRIGEVDLTQLSQDGQRRLTYLKNTLSPYLRRSATDSLGAWIKATWEQLHGPDILTEDQINNCNSLFALLDEYEYHHHYFDIDTFEMYIEKLHESPANVDQQIQVMTIHKSKGLEFDHVILPHVEAASNPQLSELLLWQEFAEADQDDNLIFAPMKSANEQHDQTYYFVQQLEKQKLSFEAERLLYVALTRAKQSIHLLADMVNSEDGTIQSPANGSFLAMLNQTEFLDHGLMESDLDTLQTQSPIERQLIRIPTDLLKIT